MGGTKHQHFIPRSYLKNFATVDGDKHFVEVMDKETGKITYPRSTKDICVQKNLYTIPRAPENEKYSLERYYAENVDTVYPEVYEILTDKSIEEITEEQRAKILSTCLSLYFRSPKFLDSDNEELDREIARLRQFKVSPTADLLLRFKGRDFSCKPDQIDAMYQEAKEYNKLNFIVNHFQQWQECLKYKRESGIMVIDVEEEVPLITCDNPVDIYKPGIGKVNVFDPINTIQLTLDRRHYLWIAPQFLEGNGLRIVRSPRDKYYALVHNESTEKNAIDWIIGEKDTIEVYKSGLTKYSKANPENTVAWNARSLVAIKMFELDDVIERHGFHSTVTKNKLKELGEISALQVDPGFQHLLAAMRKKFGEDYV